MTTSYPGQFEDISRWARNAGVSVGEARKRYAQYAVLRAITAVPQLRQSLVFKGGNALDFVWQPNRSTSDLDFSIDPAFGLDSPDEEAMKLLLERGCRAVEGGPGVVLRVHRIRRDPPGEDKDFVTLHARIGYVLPDEDRLRLRVEGGEASPNVIALDLSFNEPICAADEVQLDDALRLRVATVEDILAEKLRALLQQPIRNRQREQDLLDVALIVREHRDVDRAAVSRFLLAKAAARAIAVTRATFRNPEVAERAKQNYAALESTTRITFIPFDEALADLLGFVERLDIPG